MCARVGSDSRVDTAETKIWWSGGGFGGLHTFDLIDGKLTRTDPTEVAPKKGKEKKKKKNISNRRRQHHFPAGYAWMRRRVCCTRSASIPANCRSSISRKARQRPWPSAGGLTTCSWGPTVTNSSSPIGPAGKSSSSIRKTCAWCAKIRASASIPNQMVLHPKDDRLFVACANEQLRQR